MANINDSVIGEPAGAWSNRPEGACTTTATTGMAVGGITSARAGVIGTVTTGIAVAAGAFSAAPALTSAVLAAFSSVPVDAAAGAEAAGATFASRT